MAPNLIPQDNVNQARPRKRNRPVLSCGHCRFRKLKCDRCHPCGACVRSGDRATCVFDPIRPSGKARETGRNGLADRVERLESVLISVLDRNQLPVGQSEQLAAGSVVSLLPEEFPPQDSVSKEENELVDEFGSLDIGEDRTVYVGGSNWVSILREVQEYRTYLEGNSDELERDAVEHDLTAGKPLSLLRGNTPPASREELIRSVPPRQITDKLVARFLDSCWQAVPCIHKPTFQQEYLAFWSDPLSATPSWLGMLFAMLNLASLVSYGTTQDEGSPDCQAEGVFKLQVIQALKLADYWSPQKYTIETLIIYIHAEWLVSQDIQIEASCVLDIAIRLAMRMGIHRDGKAHPISPLQGEMRRRIWALLRQMDILCSFQLSLPPMIHPGDSNCSLPRNLDDSDFADKSVRAAKALSEMTEMSYTIHKTRLVIELGKVLRLLESVEIPSQDDVAKHEKLLDNIRHQLPAALRPGSENMTLKKQGVNIDRMYQASRCLLHLKYLRLAHADTAYSLHRVACIDAALALLSHQAALFLECDTSYPQNVRLRNVAIFMTHDFLVAAVAIALDLYYGFSMESGVCSYRRLEMITALEISNEFWGLCRDVSVENAKAHGLFSYVLMKAKGNISEISPASLGFDASLKDDELMAEFEWNLWNQYSEIDGFSGFDVTSVY